MMKKMVVHSPTTSSKMIQSDLLLTSADVSTSTINSISVINLGSELVNLLENLGLHLP